MCDKNDMNVNVVYRLQFVDAPTIPDKRACFGIRLRLSCFKENAPGSILSSISQHAPPAMTQVHFISIVVWLRRFACPLSIRPLNSESSQQA